MPTNPNKPRASDWRVWLIDCRAGPEAVPEYQGCMTFGDPSWPQGDVTREECPSDVAHGAFDVYDEIPGGPENPTSQLKTRYTRSDLATLLDLTRRRKPFDVQLLMGRCNSPTDYLGWDKILVMPGARIKGWSGEKLTAMAKGDNAATNEMADISAIELYEILPLVFANLDPATVVYEILTVEYFQQPNVDGCLECADQHIVFALQQANDAGNDKPAIIWSDDNGETLNSDDVTTMADTDTAASARIVGNAIIVLDTTGNSYHWSSLAAIRNGAGAWVEQSSGFVATDLPNAAYSANAGHTWIVADNGYIYFLSAAGAAVRTNNGGDAGQATTENLLAIHGIDARHIVAVGANNAVVVTDDGGLTWLAITGPNPGQLLRSVLMLDENKWLVGDSTGALWSTVDGGVTWNAEDLPVTLTDVRAIARIKDVVYVGGVDANSAAIVLRSTALGASGCWYVLPNGAGTIPAGQRINSIAVFNGDPNLFIAGGLGAVTDGMLVRANP